MAATFTVDREKTVVFNARGGGAVIMAGWTGRRASDVQKHIDELAAAGVRAPSQLPVFYRVSAALVTTADNIEVVGPDTSGEIELVVMQVDGRRYVGVGSDHTDNKMEAHSVALAKQLCSKVIGPDLWNFDDVAAHWDKLELHAFVTENGERTLYQKALAEEFRRPDEMLRLLEERTSPLPGQWMMFCGACSAIGGIRPTPTLELELRDPVLGKILKHAYSVRALPEEH